MARSFCKEQVQERIEQTNKLLQYHRKSSFIHTEISLTSRTLKGQLVKPSFIDHRHRMLDTTLHSKGPSVGTGLVPVRAPTVARGRVRLILDATGYEKSDAVTLTNTLSHASFSKGETRERVGADQLELPLVNTRWPETTPSKPTQVPVNASWDRTASPSCAPTRFPLATLTRQYLILLGVLLAEYRTTW